MRIQLLLFAILMIVIGACKSSSKSKSLCDDPCLKDTLKYTGKHVLRPYVYISARDCKPDSIIWSYDGMGVNRKLGLSNFLNTSITLDKDLVRCVINDTAYAWVFLNDCATSRGYQIKIPFNKTSVIGRKSSGINNMDPRFIVADNLVVNTDRGNIYVEDMGTGKKAMMTFGQALDIDYDSIHDWIDSVNITDSHIRVRVKIDDKWKILEKNITLE